MQRVEPPFPATGPDRHCPDCGRLLIQVNGDGTFNLAENAGARGQMDESDEGILLVEGVCFQCHPDLADTEDSAIGQIPLEVRQAIGRALGILPTSDDEKPDDRIKLPWQ